MGALYIPPHCVRDNVQVLDLYWKLNVEESVSTALVSSWTNSTDTYMLYWNSVYSGPPLIRTPWDQGVVGYVKRSDN